jgi:hypothetical protein
VVEEPDWEGAFLNGKRRSWRKLRPSERLRLVAPDGSSPLLDCTMDDLIEPIAAAGAVKKAKKAAAGGGTAADAEALGGLRPERARIRGVDRA